MPFVVLVGFLPGERIPFFFSVFFAALVVVMWQRDAYPGEAMADPLGECSAPPSRVDRILLLVPDLSEGKCVQWSPVLHIPDLWLHLAILQVLDLRRRTDGPPVWHSACTMKHVSHLHGDGLRAASLTHLPVVMWMEAFTQEACSMVSGTFLVAASTSEFMRRRVAAILLRRRCNPPKDLDSSREVSSPLWACCLQKKKKKAASRHFSLSTGLLVLFPQSPPKPSLPPPPELNADAIFEILIRIPPDEPAHLIHASLVCKSWLRLLFDLAFLCRYREFHRTPPLLGFLHNEADDVCNPNAGFIPTTSVPFLVPAGARLQHWWALDCRHGRVLFHHFEPMALIVWDPITGDQKQVPVPSYPYSYCTGAVLCAVSGCDHLGCCGGPFLVVFVGNDKENITWVSMYSSETGVWSPSATVDLSVSANADAHSYVDMKPSNLTGDALYFILDHGKSILKYGLGERSLSMVDPPKVYKRSSIVMTAEGGTLGFAGIEDESLYLWSWKDGDGDIAGWTLCMVIKLDGLIPTCDVSFPRYAGVITLDFKSRKVRKVGMESVVSSQFCRTRATMPHIIQI
ncbi:hypothetical protein EJB05_54223, partial [Eragrostis curvula]